MAGPSAASNTPKAPVNRKAALYVVSGIGVLILLAMVLLFARSNPQAARERAAEQAKEQALKALPAGSAEQAAQQIQREAQQLGDTSSLYNAPLASAQASASKPAAASTSNMPSIGNTTLADLDKAYKASGKPESPISGTGPSDNGGLSLSGSSANGNSGTFEAYPKQGGVVQTAAQATGFESSSSGTPKAYAAISPMDAPASRILTQGTFIRAALMQGIDTRNPGNVNATVTQNVYSSLGDGTVLIPRGSRLVGSYEIKVSAGLPRIPVAFRRLILPDGRAIDLGGMQAVNYAGDVGVDGNYHSNILRALGPSLIVALIGTGVDRLDRKNEAPANQATPYGTVVQSPSIADQMAPQVNSEVMQRYSSALPYFIVKAGTQFKVMTTKDIVIPAPDDRVKAQNASASQQNAMPGSGAWEAGDSQP